VPATGGPRTTLVGRDAELAQLHQWYAVACQGQRQVVCITGEVSIGKTTLVDTFVTQVVAGTDLWVGRGQCEDVHWSDGATLDWLAYVAQRRGVARRLVLGRTVMPVPSEGQALPRLLSHPHASLCLCHRPGAPRPPHAGGAA